MRTRLRHRRWPSVALSLVAACSILPGQRWIRADAGLPRAAAGVRTLVIDPINPSTIYAQTSEPWSGTGNVFKSSNGGGSWSLLGGLSQVGALVVDPANSSTLYAVAHGHVVKSTDGGQSWSGASVGLTAVSALAIDPEDTSAMYAMTTGDAMNPGGVFESNDGGASWRNKQSAGLPAFLWEGYLVIDPVDSSTIYATIGANLYKSKDGGDNWRALLTPQSGGATCNCPVAIDPTHTSTLYVVASNGGIFKSTDGGETWNGSSLALPANASITSFAIDPTAKQTIYASYVFGDPMGGVVKSIDGGATWTVVTGLPDNTPPIYALALNPANPSTIYAGYYDSHGGRGGVYRSANGGANWNDSSAGLALLDIHTVVTDPVDGAVAYAAAGDSIYRSGDRGQHWSMLTQFPNSFPDPVLSRDPLFIQSVLIDPSNHKDVYASFESTGGCYFLDRFLRKSMDGGATWSDLTPTFCLIGNASLAADSAGSNTLYVATETLDDCGQTPVFTSSDSGASWSETYVDGDLTSLVVIPGNPATVYAGDGGSPGGVIKTIDGGKTWNSTGLTGVRVLVLALDPTNSTILYAGTAAQWPDNTPGLLKSTDGGATWSVITSGLGGVVNTRAPIMALAVDSSGGVLYLGTSGSGVFRSMDGGASWAAFNEGLESLDVRTLAVTCGGSHVLYAATPGGVFKIEDKRERVH